MHVNDITHAVIGAGIEVHRELGPGLLESAYEQCLAFELRERGLRCERQVEVPLRYKGIELRVGYQLDLLVENSVVVEIKAVDRLHPIHRAQLLTYLRITDRRIGLLMNFNVPVLRDGIERMVHRLDES